MNHTLFIYMEADLELQWPALQAWAQDEEILAPLGFHRGFVRTEISQWSGEIMAFDQTEHTIVGLEGSPALATRSVHSSGRPQKGAPATQSNHVVQLKNAYMAMWLASRQQLAACMMAPEWAPDLNTFKQRLPCEEAAFNLYRTKESSWNRGGHSRVAYLFHTIHTLLQSKTLPHCFISQIPTVTAMAVSRQFLWLHMPSVLLR